MESLDKYKKLIDKNKGILSSAEVKSISGKTEEKHGVDLDLARRLNKMGIKVPGFQDYSELYTVIAFDTTGSMSSCISSVRGNIEEIADELPEQEDNVQIMVGGVGEYCDAPYTLQLKDFRKNSRELKRDIGSIEDTSGGGACQVSLELLFQELNRKYIQRDKNYSLIVFTDQIAHGQDNGERTPRADYRKELKQLKENLSSFYIINCSSNQEIINLQRELLEPGNDNEKLILLEDTLADSRLIPSLIIALTKRTISKEKEEEYIARLKSGTQEQRNTAQEILKYLPHKT
ncbi:MAG: vWA domain-containing protein [Nanoarchaeota archaeon]